MSVRIVRRDHGLAVVEPPGDVPLGRVLAVRPPSGLCFLREDPHGGLERDIAVARLLSSSSAAPVIAVDDLRYTSLAQETALGVSLGTFFERHHEEGGALDEVVAQAVSAAVHAFAGDVGLATGEMPRIDVDDVWLGWDGSVRVYATGAPGGAEWLDERIPQAPASTEPMDARAAVAGVLGALFRDERARELEWLEELFIEEITEPVLVSAPGPTVAQLLSAAVTVDNGVSPPLLVTDLVTASVAVEAANRVQFPRHVLSRAPSSSPIVDVNINDAGVLSMLLDPARQTNPWRLPTDAEYDRFSDGGGVGVMSRFGVRGLCRVWELTSTASLAGGTVVRGGKWRNRAQLASVANTSREDRPASDVGFRAVRYVNDDDAPWEPRT